ncbi:MAG: ATP-binding cassette domain-containing protein, partial [Lentisphaerae bacterium]|nr:ATP-binding cassette domain-containing protein [Lentisphaerota bacterium]
YLDRVGLMAHKDKFPGQLSGGQQQRVAIARALANDPSIILADEPTANLDMHTGEEIIGLLAHLCRQEGVTVITATHDHKMLATSDRIVWIKGGAVDRIQKVADMDINVGKIEPQ